MKKQFIAALFAVSLIIGLSISVPAENIYCIDDCSELASCPQVDITNHSLDIEVVSSAQAMQKRIGMGYNHSFAIKDDGKLLSWGYNNRGQLGIGNTTNRSAPGAVSMITQVTGVVGGGQHSLALTQDGKLWSWGYNANGQLGNGNRGNQPTPGVRSVTGGVMVDGGRDHSLLLKYDGTVWAWGFNASGQLGNGSTINYATSLVRVGSLTNVVDMAAGGEHGIALRENGSVWAWGSNASGRLGDGTTTNRSTPVQVSNLANVVAVSAGWSQSMALKSDGTVWGWGHNGYGRLGDGTIVDRTTPVQVIGLSNVVAVVTKGGHSLALKNDGTVWSWGYNNYGQLGDGTTINRSIPVQIPGLSDVVEIAAGEHNSMALKEDGSVWSWGYNGSGQLGDGTTTDRKVPTFVMQLTEKDDRPNTAAEAKLEAVASEYKLSGAIHLVSDIDWFYVEAAADGMYELQFAGSRDSLKYKVWNQTLAQIALDSNNCLQLSAGERIYVQVYSEPISPYFYSTYTLQISKNPNIVSIEDRLTAGEFHSAIRRPDGTIWSFGRNHYGQLGNGSTTDSLYPVLSGLADISGIRSGDTHSVAMSASGKLWVWGHNSFGKLGNGNETTKNTPVELGIGGMKAFDAGMHHTVAVRYNGTVWCWGNNAYGQLGDGTTVKKSSPVQVKNLRGVVAVAAGDNHTLALKEDGSVWAWGQNGYGQLGSGGENNSSVPVKVKDINDVVAIAAGQWHSLALKNDGTVWAWGYGGSGQLGQGFGLETDVPVQVRDLANITHITAGKQHSIALSGDGTVWSFGQNTYGQLGDNTTVSQQNPVKINIENVVEVTSGANHVLALKQDGTIWGWGYNEYGQLGEKDRLLKAPAYLMPLDDTADDYPNAHNEAAISTLDAGMAKTWNGWLHNEVDVDWLGVQVSKAGRYLIGFTTQQRGYRLELYNQTLQAIPRDSEGYVTLEAGTVLYLKVIWAGEEAFKPGSYLVSIWEAYRTVHVTVTDENVTDFGSIVYTVGFDPTIYEVENLCVGSYPKATAAGAVTWRDIVITEVGAGYVKFRCTKDIPSGQSWSGVVNILSLREIGIGNVEVTVTWAAS